jgi:hypothetical protein
MNGSTAPVAPDDRRPCGLRNLPAGRLQAWHPKWAALICWVTLATGGHAQSMRPAASPQGSVPAQAGQSSPSIKPGPTTPSNPGDGGHTEVRASPPTPKAGPDEPVVQRGVIEDEGARIEELRVRGQVQRIRVTPKGGGAVGYEIMPGDGSGSEASRSTSGKRVWNVLQF